MLARMDWAPRPLLDGIVRVFDPQQLILFGSHARGGARADSGMALDVVAADDIPQERPDWREAEEVRRDCSGAVDIIVEVSDMAADPVGDGRREWRV